MSWINIIIIIIIIIIIVIQDIYSHSTYEF